MGGEQLDAFRIVAEQAIAQGVDPSRSVLAQVTSHGVMATAQGTRWDDMGPGDLVVVMDVDPVKEVMLLSGPGEASCWAGVLFLVMRHREGVNAACFQAPVDVGSQKAGPVRGPDDAKGPMEATRSRGWGFQEDGVPEAMMGRGSLLEWTSSALKRLKTKNVVAWDGGGLLVTGQKLDDLVPAFKTLKPADRPEGDPSDQA